MDINRIVWEGVDCIVLVKGRAGCCEHGDEPSGSVKDVEFID
jgi:hypothetical protein